MLRKRNFDNSVRYVSKDDHSHSEQTPPISKERKKMVPLLDLHKKE